MWERTCDTSHIYETYDMNWPDLSWESPSSASMALDWLLLSQSLKVFTLQFGLTNVRPKRSKIEDFFAEVSQAEKHLFFLRRNLEKKTPSFIGKSMEWKHFWRCIFFCSVFLPRIGSGLHPIFFTLWLFSLSGKHAKQKDQRRKVVGVDWSSIFCCCQLS